MEGKHINIGLAVLAVIILLFLIGSYYSNNGSKRENFVGDYESVPSHHTPDYQFQESKSNDHTTPTGHVHTKKSSKKNEHASADHVDTTPDTAHHTAHDTAHHTAHDTAHDKAHDTAHHRSSDHTIPKVHHQEPSLQHIPESHPKTSGYGGSCAKKELLTAKDLLPDNSQDSPWSLTCPRPDGDASDVNFLDAGHHIGVNTIGQSLRNPNLQLRSEPPCPQVKVSPWQQSTIEPDSCRRPLEVGACDC